MFLEKIEDYENWNNINSNLDISNDKVVIGYKYMVGVEIRSDANKECEIYTHDQPTFSTFSIYVYML